MRKIYYLIKVLLTRWVNASGILMTVAAGGQFMADATIAPPSVVKIVMDDVIYVQSQFAYPTATFLKLKGRADFVCADDAMARLPENNDVPDWCGSYWVPSWNLIINMNKRNHFSPLVEDVLYGTENYIFDDDVGKSLLDIWQAGVCDERIAQMIQYRVSKHRLQQAFSGMPYRMPKLTEGDLVLGFDLQNRPLLMPVQYLNAHSLMVAGSGAGKTTCSRFKILQIASRVKGMWLWDLRKREFRILRPYLARLGIDLIIIPGRELRINPLQLPLGVEPADWIPRVAEMLVEVLDLPPRASKLLQSKLFRLYRRFGIFEEKTSFPTFFDLFEEIKEDKKSNPQARMAILDSLDPVLMSLGPEVLAYRYGWTTHELAQKQLAFELGGCAEVDKNLILNSLMLSEFTSRIARGISNPQMDIFVCCDEANRICSKSASTSGHSAIGSQIELVRGTGIGLDLSVLSMNDILPQVPSNTATKILGRCGSAADYNAAGHNMGLTTEQIQWAQLHLRPGLFIGQLGEGNWRYPFVFQVPPMDFPTAEPDDAPADVGPLKALPIVPA
jgi:hypothetical protein